MPLRYVGPTIAIAVNLPLAVWALIKQPRNPAYRLFALFGVSLAIWNLGGEVFHHGGAESIWQRLSFFGMALAPANFLCLALVARGPAPDAAALSGPRGGYWHLLLYAPMVALGLALNPAMIVQKALSHSWLSGFYVMSAPETLAFGAVTASYLVAALWISWRAGRGAAEGEDWPFYMVQLPFAAGTLCVLAVAYLHSEKSPTVSLWAMVMSQYAMFMMIRHGLVGFELSLKRGVALAFMAVVLAACVLLGLALISVFFGRTFSPEMILILVVCAVALCVLYAALVPRLEEFFDAIFHRNRNH
ncbi:MAG: hypothetical protein ACLQVA_01520 [Candidatus Brocadiia bacterium]